jgi:sugar phosphate isomerase/epimerase
MLVLLAGWLALCSHAQPQTGWIDLLDASGLEAWQTPAGAWRLVGGVTQSPQDRRRLVPADEAGKVLFNGTDGRTTDLLTLEEFGDVEAQIEFCIPAESNSGIFFMGRYEIQILDNPGPAANGYPGNACGGIYPRWLDDQNVGGCNPRANARRPAGQWQRFDVVFRAPRFDAQGHKIAHARFVRVLHNGALVHENVDVTGPTRGARFSGDRAESAVGPLQVQGSHGPVAFRTLRVRRLDPGTSAPGSNAFVAMDTLTKQRHPNSALSVAAQLDMVQAAGYSGVTWNEGSPAETKALFEAATVRGLQLTALYYGAAVNRTGVTWSPSLPETMALLKGSGTIIWLHLTSRDFPRSTPEGDTVAVPALRTLADQAAAHGLRLALYPHRGDWTERVQDAVRVARKAAHPALGVTFNLCHCLMVGDEERIPGLLTDAAPYLLLVTVNGADTGAAGTDWKRLIQPLDRGSFDLLPMLRHLDALGYTGPVAMQGYGLKGDVADNLNRSLTAWRKWSEARRKGAPAPAIPD